MRRDSRMIVTKVINRFDIIISGSFENPKLFYTNKPYSGEDYYIRDILGNEVVAENPCPGKRPYFVIKSDNQPDILGGERLVGLSSVENFRDQGGLIAANGRMVKWGRFMRGGAFANLDEEGKAFLDTLGIRNIYDYRDIDEHDEDPDYHPAGAAHHLIPAIREPWGQANGTAVLTLADQMNQVTCEEHVEIAVAQFIELYNGLPLRNPAYKAMLEALDSEDTVPLYQHCSAGKDRTGVGCALLLLALGVDRDTVMGDYFLSATYREEDNKLFLAKHMDMLKTPFAVKAFSAIMSVEERFLNAAFNSIDNEYPDFDTFMLEEYGVTAERMAHWRELHLV